MKTSQDPRHRKRQQLVQELFSRDFQNQPVSKVTQLILTHKEYLDSTIQHAAPDFPVEKTNKIDLAILRLAAYEILIEKKEPQNVIIDEAVELAKEFGNTTSPSFVNGVLGHIITYAQAT
ncbi:MAG TPA: transcription antitermination factor NusB [Methylomirabilota bacterium]|nr:transcription antitermination factor NusB [Methylomirabilota bacterium]